MSKLLTPLEIATGIQENYIGLTVATARRYIAEDCVVHEATSLPFGGQWRGPEGFVELMRTIQRTFANFRFTPAAIVTDHQEQLAFRGRVSGDTPHGRFDIPFVEYWTCRNGKVCEAFAMWFDTKLVMDLYQGTHADAPGLSL